MPLVFSALVPHPPIIVATVGQPTDLERVKKTRAAMAALTEKFKTTRPDLVILISPHGPIHPDTFLINLAPFLSGSLASFGDLTTNLEYAGAPEFGDRLLEAASRHKLSVEPVTVSELDHGAVVPLTFLAQSSLNFSLLPVSYSFTDLNSHLSFGRLIRDTIKQSAERVALIGSGDLSHRLMPGAPAGFSPRGQEFDRRLLELIGNKDCLGITTLAPDFVEEAGECGFRTLLILMGALENCRAEPEILSYEGPFGVGYAVIHFGIKGIQPQG